MLCLQNKFLLLDTFFLFADCFCAVSFYVCLSDLSIYYGSRGNFLLLLTTNIPAVKQPCRCTIQHLFYNILTHTHIPNFPPYIIKSCLTQLSWKVLKFIWNYAHIHTHTHNGRFFSIATIMLLLILCPVNNKSNNCKFLLVHKVASSLLYKIRFLKTNMWLWKIVANRRTIILKIRR